MLAIAMESGSLSDASNGRFLLNNGMLSPLMLIHGALTDLCTAGSTIPAVGLGTWQGKSLTSAYFDTRKLMLSFRTVWHDTSS